MAGLAVLVILILAAAFPEAMSTHSAIGLSLDMIEPPSAEHYFGTDQFGRDIYSRSIVGARVSLVVGVVTVLLAVVIGVPLGALAPTSSPPRQQSLMRKETSPPASTSWIVPSSQEIRLRNNQVKSHGDPTRESAKQHTWSVT